MIEAVDSTEPPMPNDARWRELVRQHPDPERLNLALWPISSESVGFPLTRKAAEYPMPQIPPHGVCSLTGIAGAAQSHAFKIDALIVPPSCIGWRIEALILGIPGQLRSPVVVDTLITEDSLVIPLGSVVADHYYAIARNLNAKPTHFRGGFWCRWGRKDRI